MIGTSVRLPATSWEKARTNAKSKKNSTGSAVKSSVRSATAVPPHGRSVRLPLMERWHGLRVQRRVLSLCPGS